MNTSHRKLIALAAIVAVAFSGGVGMTLYAQSNKRDGHLSAAEYRALVAKDSVLQFVERVNKAAVRDPLWNENYALALYRTFSTETSRHLIDLGVKSIELDQSAPE